MKELMRSLIMALVALCTFWLQAQDGANDATFNVNDVGFGQGDGATQGPVNACLVQPNGKIIIGGAFLPYNTAGGRGIYRLNADGTLDATFLSGTGVIGKVNTMAYQPDGKIIIGGPFTSYNGTPCSYIARLNTDGSIDMDFDPGTGPSGEVNAIALQSDGKIIIAGMFFNYNGTVRNKVARLNSDGSLDTSFDSGSGPTGSSSSTILSIVQQPDGKINIGGDFITFNGTARRRTARLNADGTLDTGFNPGTGANSIVRSIALQSDGRILIGGDFTSVNSTSRNRIARLNANGSVDTSFDPGNGVESASGAIHCIAIRPNGKILIGGWISTYNGAIRNKLASLNINGSLDTGFDPGAGPNQTVRCLALQADGQVIIGGDFILYGTRVCGRLARVNEVGTIDTTFNVGSAANDQISSAVEQPDGKILIGGGFTSYNGAKCDGLTRLNSDGSKDSGFNLGPNDGQYIYHIALQPDGKIVASGMSISFDGYIKRFYADGSVDAGFNVGYGPSGTNSRVLSAAVQADGKILIGGNFSGFDITSSKNLARLNADGSVDATFNSGTGPNSTVQSLVVQPDGKIIIVGLFTSYNGTACNYIARLNPNGSLDGSFNTGTASNVMIYSIALQPDGKIIIGGGFTTFNGVPLARVARLNSDGTVDTGFNPGTGANATVTSITLQPDGRIVVTGNFASFNGVARSRIARLDPSGGLDTTFDPGTGSNGSIGTCALQADGKFIIGGGFTSYAGIGRNRIARIHGSAQLNARIMLDGPYAAGEMNDALRTLPSFPLTEPFTGLGYSRPVFNPGATIRSSLLTAIGNNAIVDWVIVEMRPAASPSTVAASRAVLLQRDGDAVDLDGVSTVGFSGLAPGDYSVAVISRNHLPVMLSPSTPIAFGGAVANVDFTLPTTQVFDNDARVNVGGTMTIAAGDVNFNGTVAYTGTSNDCDLILQRIGGVVSTTSVTGYWPEDVNMDGIVRYTGTGNDRDRVLLSIGGTVPTATRVASLP